MCLRNMIWFVILHFPFLVILAKGNFGVPIAKFGTLQYCKDHMILGEDILRKEVRSSQHCAALCSQSSECIGFNIEKQDSKYSCELKTFSAPVTSCGDTAVQSAPRVDFYLKGTHCGVADP